MQYPMRRFGLNLYELFLVDLLNLIGWALVIWSVLTGLFWLAVFGLTATLGGVLITVTAGTGMMLLFAGTGIRQNRPALNIGYVLLLLTSIGWMVVGLTSGRGVPLLAGIIMFGVYWFAYFVRRLAIYARFTPRFLSTRQFEVMIQIADTMIEGDGDEAASPEEVAIRVDHMLAEMDSPVKNDLRLFLTIVEWLLPLVIFRPFPFSSLGSNERRRAVNRVVDAEKGPLASIFGDVARTLKVLTSAGYYGSPKVMESIGYVPFDQRERKKGVDDSPLHHPDPFPR